MANDYAQISLHKTRKLMTFPNAKPVQLSTYPSNRSTDIVDFRANMTSIHAKKEEIFCIKQAIAYSFSNKA